MKIAGGQSDIAAREAMRISAGTPLRRERGGLAPWQLKRACEAMEAHLDEDIGLDMLAGIAGCSPTHFSRAFKQSTGMPPFQWLLERRSNERRLCWPMPARRSPKSRWRWGSPRSPNLRPHSGG